MRAPEIRTQNLPAVPVGAHCTCDCVSSPERPRQVATCV